MLMVEENGRKAACWGKGTCLVKIKTQEQEYDLNHITYYNIS
jgi:hypothetical protein